MGFLVRATRRALAGWSDDFNRPDEPAIQAPWGSWGNVAAFQLRNNRMKLAADGAPPRGGKYDGGVAFAYQPLTPNWGVEFVRAPLPNDGNTEQNIFLDKNWTEGGNAASTLYQVTFFMESVYVPEKRDPETNEVTEQAHQEYRVGLATRDKVNTETVWVIVPTTVDGTIGSSTYGPTYAEWVAGLTVRLHVYMDRYVVGYINGNQRLFLDLYDPNFQFNNRKRSANFAQVKGLVASIDNFKTYDIPPEKTLFNKQWNEIFYDSFDRPNSTSVGNGWTQTTGDKFGIYNNGLSMDGGAFAFGTDGFRQVRRDTGSPNMKVEFVLGGDGTGNPSNNVFSYVLGRLTPDGKKGICIYIRQKIIWMGGWEWDGNFRNKPNLIGAPFLFLDFFTWPTLAEGTRYSLTVEGDSMWLRNETAGGRVIQYREGVNAIVPESPENSWAGAMIMRNLGTNSVAMGEMRLYT